jgi:hypothetical protein
MKKTYKNKEKYKKNIKEISKKGQGYQEEEESEKMMKEKK